MIIVSQDKTMILNMDNIEIIAIGSPLNYEDGKFGILVEVGSDNQYTIAKYENEERAKEVLQEIVKKYKEYVSLENINIGTIGVANIPLVYEMPKE